MGIILGILISILGVFLVLLLRSFTTLFHELGHAIPALLFTKGHVKVYIGSYGDITHTLRANLARLTIYFKINLFDWKIGMCSHDGAPSFWKTVLIIIGGPLTSLLLSIPLMIILYRFELPTIIVFILSLFIMSSLIDFFVNIIPFRGQIALHDGSVSYSDGYLLLSLISRLSLTEKYLHLEELFLNQKYHEVISQGEKELQSNQGEKPIFDIVIASYMKNKDYRDATSLINELATYHPLTLDDQYTLGKAHMMTEEFELALSYFNQYYQRNFTNYQLLNDMAYTNTKLGHIDRAFQNIHASLHYAPNNPVAYLNKGLAHMKIKDWDQAEEDLLQALFLDKENSFIHFHLGDLYKKKGEYQKSIKYYQQAKNLGCDHHGIDYTIEMLSSKVNLSS